jgi:hypothetical protein
MPLALTGSAVVLFAAALLGTTSATAAVPRGGGIPAPVIHGRSPFTKEAKGIVTSQNWSGYAITGETFTDVQGSWTQPAASCPTNKQEDSAFWVGIDGYSSTDDNVEQTGTDSDCNKGKKGAGTPHYYAWWEIDTATSTSSVTIPEPVSPGDQMSAEVSNSGGTYTLTLTDAGRWTYSPGPQTPVPTPQASSAEWIAEAPSVCTKKCVPVKLANFRSVTFTGASANGASIASFTSSQTKKIEMEKGKTIKAVPTPLLGSGFTVNWQHN